MRLKTSGTYLILATRRFSAFQDIGTLKRSSELLSDKDADSSFSSRFLNGALIEVRDRIVDLVNLPDKHWRSTNSANRPDTVKYEVQKYADPLRL
jgi:hypothetical protein